MNEPNGSRREPKYDLIVRQQPCRARLCSFKEKVDRRPIDPPPIVQLINHESDDDFLHNPYFFLYATLTNAIGEKDLNFVNGNRTTAGTVVQSLHKLKDIDNTDGGFFIFSDISVRLEGYYRLKFTLYEIDGTNVNRICSILSDVFQIFSPKSFPGMSESTVLTRSFSDQGVRIRIRKEPRCSSSTMKRRRNTNESDDDDSVQESNNSNNYMELSPLTKVHHSEHGRSPSPLHDTLYNNITPHNHNNHMHDTKNDSMIKRDPSLLSSPKCASRSSAMSMQNILSTEEPNSMQFSPSEEHFPPHYPPEESNGAYHHNGLLASRRLPLPLPSSPHKESSHLPHIPSWPADHLHQPYHEYRRPHPSSR